MWLLLAGWKPTSVSQPSTFTESTVLARVSSCSSSSHLWTVPTTPASGDLESNKSECIVHGPSGTVISSVENHFLSEGALVLPTRA